MKDRLLGVGISLVLLGGLFGSTPTSTNYTLKTYDFGTGGGSGSSTNYKLDASTGSQSGQALSSTSYASNSGEVPTQNANVPPAPTLTNPSSEYNRLKLVLNAGSDPTDTKYNIAISTDNFVTTLYVQTDNTIGSGLSISNFQTYATWGGASGFWIIGLTPGTTYKVKVRALKGQFSGSPYGPATAGVATVQPTITFSVATSLTSTPPLNIGFTSLPAGSVTSANYTAILGITSNAMMGGTIYVKDLNSGLTSSSASYTITSATADLSVASKGYGAMVTSTSQSSGGPLASVSPFNGTVSNVGGLNTSWQAIATTSLPITTGSFTTTLKAKTDAIVPGATDYADTLTFIAAMLF